MTAYGMNGDPLTPEEAAAISSLQRLAKRWPKTLRLISMGGSLHVMHVGDERYDAPDANSRNEVVLDSIPGIPNDGGDW